MISGRAYNIFLQCSLLLVECGMGGLPEDVNICSTSVVYHSLTSHVGYRHIENIQMYLCWFRTNFVLLNCDYLV